MDVEVNDYITNCSVCQTHDKTAKTAPAPMQPVRYPEGAWKQIGIDFVGPFTSFSGNCRYAITAIDYYSKWPEVGFCSHPTTYAVISFLQGIFSREGYPEVLVSDHGSQFMSSELKTFLQDRGITHATSSIYYSQANGQVERFNRVLKDYIQSILLEKGDIQLDLVDFLGIYRCTPQAATNLSPSVLLHGRPMRTRLDIMGLPHPDITQNAREAIKDLRRRVERYQSNFKKYADKRRAVKTPNFRGGDYVRVRLPGHTTKGTPSFSAPVRIEKALGPATFRTEDGHCWNASKLSRTVAPTDPGTAVEVPTTESSVRSRPKRNARPPDRYSP